MNKKETIKTLFLDIGSVLLSNGWDRYSRKKAEEKFKLDPQEFKDRHQIFFETYETGKLTLDEYISHVIFYKKRDFTEKAFIDFMFEQSVPVEGSIDYFTAVKNKYALNMIAVNNEGRELNEFRIRKFGLDKLFNGFVSSCYVHVRKPDKEIFKIACDIAFTDPAQALFIDDRIIHVQIAQSMSINAIQFTNLEATKKLVEGYGFTI